MITVENLTKPTVPAAPSMSCPSKSTPAGSPAS